MFPYQRVSLALSRRGEELVLVVEQYLVPHPQCRPAPSFEIRSLERKVTIRNRGWSGSKGLESGQRRQ